MGAFVFMCVFVVIMILFIVIYVFSENRKEKLDKLLASIPDFTPTLLYKGSSVIAIDPQSERFVVVDPDGTHRVHGFSQLISVDIERNGSSLQKTKIGEAKLQGRR